MEPFAIEVRSTTYIIKENVEEACFRLQKSFSGGADSMPISAWMARSGSADMSAGASKTMAGRSSSPRKRIARGWKPDQKTI